MIIPQLEGRTLTKAHGTGNDFILVPDFAGTLDLPAESVASVCDRHFGIGADGLIRVVRTASVPETADVARDFPEAEWFMDYRNADGSIAQMCGNGLRVFVHYLRVQGVIDLRAGTSRPGAASRRFPSTAPSTQSTWANTGCRAATPETTREWRFPALASVRR